MFNPSPSRSSLPPSTNLLSSPSTNLLSPSITPSFSGANCANTYVCPGAGSGYGIQFNILSSDIDSIYIPNLQLTISAAANSDYSNGIAFTNLPLTWWWKNIVLKYPGIPGPTPMNCVQQYQNGFAVGLAQSIVSAFKVSPNRVCNAKLVPSYSPNNIDISSIKFTFYLTDIRPITSPLANDYLPCSCLGAWMMTWLSKSTNVIQPNNASSLVPASIPLELQSSSCPGLTPGTISPTLYFTSEINVDKDKLSYIEKLKESFSPVFSEKSFLSSIFMNKEHATNLIGTSVTLKGTLSSIYPPPLTIIDYFCMYSYPFCFIGAVLFSIIQIIDININSFFVNKNLSIMINVSFIIWSIVSISVYYNLSIYSVPIIGTILSANIPYVLPFNPQSVIIQY